ncbi:MAG: hypothetical protein KGI54_18475, partial [Pseudomonadota bacterium]|nr:hypothetical protein [Pseudomonadota bacterium]
MMKVNLPKLHTGQVGFARAFNENRLSVLRCGRRFGKTTLLERCAAKWSVKHQRIGWFGPTYSLNIPTYKRLYRMLRPVIESASKIDRIIELKTGGAIEFWTLQDEDAGRSRYYDKVIIDEASLIDKGLKDIWEQAIAPTLLDRNGKAIMAGTPKGMDSDNFFYEACTDKSLGWVEMHAPTSANPILSREVLDKLPEQYPALVYQQEYLAEFVDWNGASFFGLDSLLIDHEPVEYPYKTDQIFAVVDTASKDGMEHDGTGVIFYARSKYAGIPLVILDWDVVQIQASLLIDWLPAIHARLEQLVKETQAREGNVGIWIEDKDSGISLIQSASRQGLPVAPIDSVLTSQGKEG